MHKIKSGTLTSGAVKNNFKATVERFLKSDNAFSSMSSVKGTPATVFIWGTSYHS